MAGPFSLAGTRPGATPAFSGSVKIKGVQMEKRHVQTFLLVSAAFLSLSLTVRQAQAGVVEQAVTRTIAGCPFWR